MTKFILDLLIPGDIRVYHLHGAKWRRILEKKLHRWPWWPFAIGHQWSAGAHKVARYNTKLFKVAQNILIKINIACITFKTNQFFFKFILMFQTWLWQNIVYFTETKARGEKGTLLKVLKTQYSLAGWLFWLRLCRKVLIFFEVISRQLFLKLIKQYKWWVNLTHS